MINDNFFAELQMMSINRDSEHDKFRKMNNRIVEVFKNQPDYVQLVTWFAELTRKLKPSILLDHDCFMLQPDTPVNILPKDLIDDGTGFTRNGFFVYEARFVYPVKDTHGDVMGWCGYDAFDAPKYLDSMTYGYKAKQSTLFGMERIADYYRSKDPVFVTEGIVCTMWLRQEGFQAMASLGSYLTPYVIEILKRFGGRLIMVPDSDETGNHYKKQCKNVLPQARVLQSRVAKDIDDSRLANKNIKEELLKCYNRFYASPLFR